MQIDLRFELHDSLNLGFPLILLRFAECVDVVQQLTRRGSLT